MKYLPVDWKSTQLNFSRQSEGSILRIRIQRIMEKNELWKKSLKKSTTSRDDVLAILQSKQAILFARPLPAIYRQGPWDHETCVAVLQFAGVAIRAIRRREKQKEAKK